MKSKGKTGWILGIILMSFISLFMVVLALGAWTMSPSSENDDGLSLEEISAYAYRASELYCAGIYYTDKALSADPSQLDYETWNQYVSKANEYWSQLESILLIIEENSDREDLENLVESGHISNPFSLTAYAVDSDEVLRVYDGAKAGSKLKAVATYLGKDMKYAFQALQVAQGEVTAASWNKYGDTALSLEKAARVTKTAAQGAFLVVGAPAAGTAALSAEGVMFAVSGASWILQSVDDGCFIVMGDSYDNSEFVANLGSVNDAFATMTFTNDILSLDFSNIKDGVMAAYSVGETLRGVLQDGKIAGIQFKGPSGNISSMTKTEFLAYQQAKANGDKLPGEIAELLAIIEGKSLQEVKEIQVKPGKSTVSVDEWVTFSTTKLSQGVTYVWKYGGNENPQSVNEFQYMYQTPGTYTMSVTVLDQDQLPIGQGSCEIQVVEKPEDDPDDPDPQGDTQAANSIGENLTYNALAGSYTSPVLEQIWDGEKYIYEVYMIRFTIDQKGNYTYSFLDEDMNIISPNSRGYCPSGHLDIEFWGYGNTFENTGEPSPVFKISDSTNSWSGDYTLLIDLYVYESDISDDYIRTLNNGYYTRYLPEEEPDQESSGLDGTWKSVNNGQYVLQCNAIDGLAQEMTYSTNQNASVNENSYTLVINGFDYVFTYAELMPNGPVWYTLEGNGKDMNGNLSIYGRLATLGSDGNLYLIDSGQGHYEVYIKQ